MEILILFDNLFFWNVYVCCLCFQMTLRNILGLILSIGVAGAMIWACSFEIEQIAMGEIATAAGGKYKFLTILNLVNRIVWRFVFPIISQFSIFKQCIIVYALSISSSVRIHSNQANDRFYKKFEIFFLLVLHFPLEW